MEEVEGQEKPSSQIYDREEPDDVPLCAAVVLRGRPRSIDNAIDFLANNPDVTLIFQRRSYGRLKVVGG